MNTINQAAPATVDTTTAVVPVPSTPTAATTATNAKVAIAFLGAFPDAKLIVATGHIVDAMTGNTNYPTPVPALATVVTARGSYVTAVNALNRSKASLVQRNDTRAALTTLLRSLALYVQQTSAGNLGILLTSGFPVQKPKRQPAQVLAAPQKLVLRRAKVSGQILARCKAMDQATGYQWRFAPATTPTAWIQPDPVTTASYTLANLTPGTSYLVQVRALGSRGPSDWSDSATLMSA
jgi:hypothetical protein